jgi:hypothetical protein
MEILLWSKIVKNSYFIIILSITVFLGVFSGSRDASAAFKLCQDMVEQCRSTSAIKHSFCVGYLAGLADTKMDGTCIPDTATPRQLQELFVKWISEHPDEKLSDAPVCFRRAMVKEFPCRPI